MKMSPLVSVLIPAYNHENYVEEAIRSVIAQTYANIELVVIDDGSKDGTWKKITALKKVCEKRFPRVEFSTQSNKGTCVTLNRLVDSSRGDFVLFLASDDAIKPWAIEKQVAFLQENPSYVLVVGDNEFIDGTSTRIGWSLGMQSAPLSEAESKTFAEDLQKWRPDVCFSSDEFGTYQSLLKGNYVPNGYLMKASALRQVDKFTRRAPLEDLHLHLQLSKLGKYKYLDEVLFSYRWHGMNTAQRREHMLRITEKTLAYELKRHKFCGRIAVHLHLYYPDQLPSFLKSLRSLEPFNYDLYVTLVEANKDVVRCIQAFKSDATIWVVENRGYDVGPFIDFLNKIRFSNYSYILKLQTKGLAWRQKTKLNGNCFFTNVEWSRQLLDALLKNKKCVRKNISRFRRHEKVNMVGSYFCICSQPLHYEKLLPRINAILRTLKMVSVNKCSFVAGTMFMARAEIFKPLQGRYVIGDFEFSDGRIKDHTLAHAFERVFGILATRDGGLILGVGDCPQWRAKWKSIFDRIVRFCYQNKRTEKKHIIKLLKMPVYYKRFVSAIGAAPVMRSGGN